MFYTFFLIQNTPLNVERIVYKNTEPEMIQVNPLMRINLLDIFLFSKND